MGCGASSVPKKSGEATNKLPDEPTTAPPPPEEDPKPDAEASVGATHQPTEAEKKEETTSTREPSEQEKQEPTPAPAEKPEDLKAWSVELGESGDFAATKMQSAHRGKQARAEVEKMKKTKEEEAGEPAKKAAPVEPVVATETPAKVPVAEEEANQKAADGVPPEELEAWASELGEGGPAAATKLQATHRGKQARTEVEKIRAAKQTGETATASAAAAPEATPAEDAAVAAATGVDAA